MRNAIWLSTLCLSVVIGGSGVATPAQIDSPDKSFRAQVEIQSTRSKLIIRNNKTNKRTVAWTGAAESIEDSVEYGKERVAKMLWAPARASDGDRLLLLVIERQRYADVYDPRAIYMLSARRTRLLWTKVFGRTWDESVNWSPHGDLIVTITSPVGPEGVKGDACVVMSATTGDEVKTIHVTDLISQGLGTVTDMESARFVNENVIKLRLYQKGSSALAEYIWRFRK